MTWSKKFSECQKCHTTVKKHICRGVCVTCYFRDYKKASKEREKKDLIKKFQKTFEIGINNGK